MTQRIAALLSIALLVGCNTHEGYGCLPQCENDQRYEAYFERCVAFGTGDCRPGNRMCCAQSAGCQGRIGDQVIVPDVSCPVLEVGCRRPCEPGDLIDFEACVAEGGDLCGAGDDACCAEHIGCTGSFGTIYAQATGVGGETCCAYDAKCPDDQYCDTVERPDTGEAPWACAPAACLGGTECAPPRSCVEGACTCLTSGTPVVQCPPGKICDAGECVYVERCRDVSCELGFACDSDDGSCKRDCSEDETVCASSEICDDGLCVEHGFCISDDECVPGVEWCAFGSCELCDASLPDDCTPGDSDCDDVDDEDCLCGDGELQLDEVCEIDTVFCLDHGFPSGYAHCVGCYDLDLSGCSDEICDNEVDDDGDGLHDCDDGACASHAVCCDPGGFELCGNGIDDDCDFLLDEGDCVFEERCDNGADDDGDGAIDCEDPDCELDPICCAPAPGGEICNGVDDDCDGAIDEDDPELGASCGSDVFPCSPGTLFCEGGALRCTGVEPTPERCNDFDDDCDGTIDEAREADLDCDDGIFCNNRELCQRGSCIPDDVPVCDDGNECTMDLCDEAADRCSNPPEPAGTSCMGFFTCDGGGACISG